MNGGRVYCNICLREARLLDLGTGHWQCSCCGRRLWVIGATFTLGK